MTKKSTMEIVATPATMKRARKNIPANVEIIFTCEACKKKGSIKIRWKDHHNLPRGWFSRDRYATEELPSRTNHIFVCSKKCSKTVDEKLPPTVVWFQYS